MFLICLSLWLYFLKIEVEEDEDDDESDTEATEVLDLSKIREMRLVPSDSTQCEFLFYGAILELFELV